ncbi:uncharacterized protein LOC142768601 isoform X2 [Rhipicephalus microplus]|uniref:uncharacterized protein LOC142768601 isoform X2 n=1 Tax=Rhipicephalus microplus TaxID=6941 RepID=UPI003F6CA70A
MVVFGQNSVVLLGSFAFFYTPWLTPTYVLAGITPSRPTPNARPAGTPQIKRRNPSVNMTAVFIDAFRSSYGYPGSPMGPPRSASRIPGPPPARRPAPPPPRPRQRPQHARPRLK